MKFSIISRLSVLVFLLISSLFTLPLAFAEATETKSAAEMKTACTPPLNVKDSLVLSTVTLCIPGMLEKTREWEEIKCEAVVCAYNSVKQGIDPAFCYDKQSYDTCDFIAGEIFAIPPMNFVSYIKDMVSNAIANPVGFAYSASIYLLRDTLANMKNSGSPSLIIQASSAFLAINDVMSLVAKIKLMIENAPWDTTTTNYCDEVDDIVKELEGVVDYYE